MGLLAVCKLQKGTFTKTNCYELVFCTLQKGTFASKDIGLRFTLFVFIYVVHRTYELWFTNFIFVRLLTVRATIYNLRCFGVVVCSIAHCAQLYCALWTGLYSFLVSCARLWRIGFPRGWRLSCTLRPLALYQTFSWQKDWTRRQFSPLTT